MEYKKHITNVDTVSALIDRLICENIKLYFFDKDNKIELVKHQQEIIDEIKNKLSITLGQCLDIHDYLHIEERRTFDINDVIDEIEKLTDYNINIGEHDRMALNGAKSNNVDDMKRGIFTFRYYNELRSRSKILIDQVFRKILA